VLLLGSLGGIAHMLFELSDRETEAKQPVEVLLGSAVVLGAVFGLLVLFIFPPVIRWTGRWLGGAGETSAIRTAIAWASVPYVASLAVWGVEFWIIGSSLVTSPQRVESDPQVSSAAAAFGLVFAALSIWAIVLFVKCVGEAQGFPAWKAVLNSILTWFVLLTGRIPRGRGKAPKVTLPERTGFKGLEEEIEAEKAELRALTVDAIRRFEMNHPGFGRLNGRQWLRFLSIHRRHHLRIISDIARAARR
jgi:hypothetical protein